MWIVDGKQMTNAEYEEHQRKELEAKERVQRVQTALIDETISAKKAGLLLYSLQLAMTNVGRTTFGQADDRELVTTVVDEEEALNAQQSAASQNKESFTAKDAKHAKEEE